MTSNLKAADSSSVREQQKQATRARILSSAVTCVMDLGVARTTTLEVQRRAAVSRGALLHHFPTHADLLCAVVDAIVVRNEDAVRKHLRRKAKRGDPVGDAIHTLVDSMREPSFLAELELWVVARTDTELREALVAAERKALRDRQRVLDEIFAPLKAFPACELAISISAEFARGLAVSGILRSNPRSLMALTQQWIWAVRQLLPLTPPGP